MANKKDRNITTTLKFQDVLDPESGEVFMSIGGTVIKRHVDDDGIELYDDEGNIEHTRVEFMMTGKELGKGIPELIRSLNTQALQQYEKEDNDKKEKEGE